jgi:DNA-binding SARP family transcriptional activator/pimeloyl-ACP methyl ester carboxylesterase
MRFRVLGSVDVVAADGRVLPLAGERQQALLAALLARANEVVSGDLLSALLWGDDPPANPEASLHSAVFRLRRTLREADGQDQLTTRDPGYCLTVGSSDVDALRFLDLVDRAKSAQPEQAAAMLGEALGLWRGSAYAGFSDLEIAQLDAIRLEEARRAAVEALGASMLAAGRHGDAIALLEPFVLANPLRERARSALMRALYAEGRAGDALAQYQGYRTRLGEDLGLEPSREMVQLQGAILRQDLGEPAAPPSAANVGLPGMRVRYLTTESGRTLAYGVTGTGPRVVVLVGWVSSLEVLASGRDPRSSLLERLSGDFTVVLFDRPGTGLSRGPAAADGLADAVAEIGDVVQATGSPVALMAMSSAGPAAVQFAAMRPELVDSLVLFGTFADGPATFSDEHLRHLVLDLVRRHWSLGSKLLADLYRPGVTDEAAWHLGQVLRDSADAEVAAAYLASAYQHDVTRQLTEVRCPSLVLHYREDRLIPFRGGRQLAAGLPTATLVPLDGAFHLPDVTDLDRIQLAITEFVRAHASDSS